MHAFHAFAAGSCVCPYVSVCVVCVCVFTFVCVYVCAYISYFCVICLRVYMCLYVLHTDTQEQDLNSLCSELAVYWLTDWRNARCRLTRAHCSQVFRLQLTVKPFWQKWRLCTAMAGAPYTVDSAWPDFLWARLCDSVTDAFYR